jgi:hypothetical protein
VNAVVVTQEECVEMLRQNDNKLTRHTSMLAQATGYSDSLRGDEPPVVR